MDGVRPDLAARIGPNAILQLVPVLDRAIGADRRNALFAKAGVALPPPDAGMLPETDVIRLHGAVRHVVPDSATLLRQAGLATGDYILAHRLPHAAQRLIRLMPAPLAARVLARAIARHAWTFAGSGGFTVDRFGPLTVSIRDNPLAAPAADSPCCHWHAAVFERLFSALVWRGAQVAETDCCATGAAACRFEIERAT